MHSVMIHHAVSGCFTCRKIICFNLLVSRSTQSTMYYAKRHSGWQHWVHHCSTLYCYKGGVVANPPLPQSILGISFQQNVLRTISKEMFTLLTVSLHTVQLAPPHRDPSSPMLTHTCVDHCLSAVLQTQWAPSAQKSNQRDADFFIPSLLNDLIDSLWMALELFFFRFYVF